MKKILYFLFIMASCLTWTSCNKNEWDNNNSEMEHIYYFGFQDWGDRKNKVTFNVKQGETLEIPVQFWSEYIRSYDVIAFYYTAGKLVLNKDYQVLDDSGNPISPDETGAYIMKWDKAVKGVKNIHIKAMNGAKGSFNILTFNPNASTPISASDVASTTNNKTNAYEVRAFSQNYKVTVNIK